MKKLIFFLLFFPIVMHAQSDFEKGEAFFTQGKYSLAKPLLENYLKENPNHTKTLEHLGDIAGSLKKWDEAIKYYKKVKLQYPNNANYWYKYGGSLGMKAKESNKFKALGMIDEIQLSFETAAKLDPKHTDARWALLIFYLELPGIIGGSEKKSQKYANELMAISKIDGLMAKGHIDEYFERYKQAETYYKQGIELTHSKTAYQKLINLYKNKMNLPEKAKLLQQESDIKNK